MTPRSAAATAVARRLWARLAGEPSTLEQVAVAAERVHRQLRVGLGRWIGVEGYRALVDRALAVAEEEHPALGHLAFFGGDQPVTVADDQADNAAALAAGVVALVAELVELLSRIVGESMAVRLVDQIGTPSPRGVVNTETEGGRDGQETD